jgi:hypothetical protein
MMMDACPKTHRERDDLLITHSLSTLEESMHQGVMEEVT